MPIPTGAQLDVAVDTSLRSWATQYKTITQIAFIAGGHHLHGGAKWKNLSIQTIIRKGHPTVLVNRGVLKNSFETKLGHLTVLFRNVAPYAPYHQFGRGVPVRKIIEFTSKDKRDLLAKLKSDLERSLNGA